MKKRLTLALVVLLSYVGNAADKYDIKITVDGMTDSVAYLGYHFGDKKYLFDTAAVDSKGSVQFEGDKHVPSGMYFLYTKQTNMYMEFIVDNPEFSLSTDRTDVYGKMKVSNSPANEAFKGFQVSMVAHQRAIGEVTSTLDSSSVKSDSTEVFDRVKELNTQNESVREDLKAKNADNVVGQILIMMEMSPALEFSSDSLSADERREEYNRFRKRYFDGIDFDSEATLRTPLFHNKMMEYVDRVTVQHPDSIIQSVDELLLKSQNNEELYRYIMVVMFQKYQSPKIMGMDKVFVHLSDEYYLKGKATWADDDMIKELKDEMRFHRENQIGMQAPYMALVDTADVPVRLYHVKSEYTVLYFYSPTCGHCKKKTPVLKEVYDKIKSKGVEVVAVCTDTDIDKWKKFIKDLKLDWLNYGDPHLKSNFRMQYNVRSTPVTYVLDKNKKIIAKKLDVEQIESFIDDQIRLNKKKSI